MKVVVVGAGYAGTIAANRLAKKAREARITVVDPRPGFVERVRLHEQIAGTGSAATPPKPFSMGYTGQALSLGRDDTPRRLYIAGRTAAMTKEAVNRYARHGSRTARYGWIPGPSNDQDC